MNKINELSFIYPCDKDRLPLFQNTLKKYKSFSNLENTEFLIPSRTIKSVDEIGIDSIDMKVIPYSFEGCFNCSMGLNLGVANSRFKNIVISSPEVLPISDVVSEFKKLDRGNYVCQVWDEDVNKNRTISLVNKHFRGETPGMYFLAIYKKEDILAINGWDEDFMGGCAWEDNDFGERFVRSGAKFEVLEYIEGQHQYHFRWYTDLQRNIKVYERNKANNVIYCKNGIIKDID